MKKLIFAAVALLTLCLINSAPLAQVTTYSVTNSSGMVISGVYLSPNDANLWGTNLNTSGNIAVERSFEFTQAIDPKNCIYDIRYIGEDGKYYYIQDVDLCNSKTIILPNPLTDKDKKMKEDSDRKPIDGNDQKPIDGTDKKPMEK